MALFLKMLVFFILIMVGCLARKLGYITHDNQPKFSGLALNICCPAMIVAGAFAEGEKISIEYACVVMGVSVLVLLAMIILGELLAFTLRFPKKERGVAVFMTVFTNIMFMGLPIVGSLYGDSVTIYFSLFIIPMNILLFTYGIRTVSRGTDNRPPMNLKQLLSPCVIACVVSVALFFTELPIPAFIQTPIQMLGAMMPPLGMLIIGSSIPDVDFGKVLRSGRIVAYILMKMIAVPVIILLMARMFTDDRLLLATIFALTASSSATFSVVLTILYNREAQPLATAEVSVTSAIAVLTMPLVAMISGIM